MSIADATIATSESTSATERSSSRWMDAASDWFNPILVKEVRQSLKSRQFVITFMLLLVGSWLSSFVNVVQMGDAIEFGSVATRVFWWYYFALAAAMFLVVPFSAFRSLLSERDENTYDLLSITTLAPRQIVRGKLLSSLVQLFIFYSAVMPFVAFTSMLKGFSWPEVAYVLGLSLLVSMLACMASLMASTLVTSKTWRALMSMAVLVGLFTLFSVFAMGDFGPGGGGGLAGAILNRTLPDDPEFWWVQGIGVLIAASYFVLFHQITTARLTFEAGNRSTGIRITCYLQFVLVWGCVLGYACYLEARHGARFGVGLADVLDDMVPVLATLTLLHFTFVGLFASTERERLSRRLRRGLPRWKISRFVAAPWLPGCGRGYAYVLGCVGSLWLLVYATTLVVPDVPADVVFEVNRMVTCGCCYVIVYCGIGCLLARLLLGLGEINPAHVRVVTLLVALGGIIVPYVFQAFASQAYRSYSPLYATVPWTTIDHVVRNEPYADEVTLLLLGAATLAILVNAGTVLRGFREVTAIDPGELRRVDDARHSAQLVPSEPAT